MVACVRASASAAELNDDDDDEAEFVDDSDDDERVASSVLLSMSFIAFSLFFSSSSASCFAICSSRNCSHASARASSLAMEMDASWRYCSRRSGGTRKPYMSRTCGVPDDLHVMNESHICRSWT